MKKERSIRVSGTGCCLVDRIYSQLSFDTDEMRAISSVEAGDGGLTPGQLVFREELEKFSGRTLPEIVETLTGGRPVDKINVGGPSIVALIHASQLSAGNANYSYYGFGGEDRDGQYILDVIRQSSVDIQHLQLVPGVTPSTVVLSDPDFDGGQGERMFINSIGVAGDFHASALDESFYDSDVVVFGGTALVPGIHRDLPYLLSRSKSSACITIVNTVFDFLNERSNPDKRWPLGGDDSGYANTDLLIMDRDEALRLSGCDDLDNALRFFIGKGTGAVVITQGPGEVLVYSAGGLFSTKGFHKLPVSERILQETRRGTSGDTTGCGDNFVGGIIASMVNQMAAGISRPDLLEAVSLGIVSGGFACFHLGGVYPEESQGEKMALIRPYYEAYLKQG